MKDDFYVRFKNASIGYKKKILVKDINLQINPGDKILLLGSNGTGKTTFFKVILSLHKLLVGEVEKKYNAISYVPQNLEISKEFLLTIYDVLDLYYVSNHHNDEKKKDIFEVLKKINLLEKKDQLLKECSGGELQRTFIARALLRKPQLLILDEPLNAVDSDNQKQFFLLLEEIYNDYQCTILMSSHIYVDDLIHFFSRKFIIKNKQILEL